jgi:hypothetical protein
MQAAQKMSEGRCAKLDKLRRTLQYVEASRAGAANPMNLFSSLLIHELFVKILHPVIAFLKLSFRRDVERFIETSATRL